MIHTNDRGRFVLVWSDPLTLHNCEFLLEALTKALVASLPGKTGLFNSLFRYSLTLAGSRSTHYPYQASYSQAFGDRLLLR